MNHIVHNVRRSLISIDPRLDAIPMVDEVAKKFLGSGKSDLKKVGSEMAGENAALHASLDELGIVEPIKAVRVGRKWIMCDGRHRIAWVDDRLKSEAGEHPRLDPKIPLIEVSAEEATRIIEGSVFGRRHWTKGQRAWLGVMQHPEVCEIEGAGRPKNSDSVGINATSLAARIGVSADIVSQAVALYRKLFAPGTKSGSPEAIEAAALRAKYEHLIWGGAGLGGVLAGIAGGESTGDKPKAKTGFHHLDAPLASLSRLGRVWLSWSAEEKSKAQALIVARVRGGEGSEGWPPEFREALAEALAAAD